MKPIYAHLCGAIALTFTVSACIPPAPEPTPAPSPSPVSTPDPQPLPPAAGPQPSFDNWMDAPRTPGNWTYRSDSNGSAALYGQSQTDARFSILCDRSRSTVTLARASDARSATPMRIRTETADRTVRAEPSGGQLPYLEASLSARDPILDAMALTKGRFAIVTQGAPTLYLPAWAEVTRVIEDCR